MDKDKLRSPLAIVRGLGSAREGTGHFIAQRVTAIVLIPLSWWFIRALLSTAVASQRTAIYNWLTSGLHASALIIMLVALFYHAKLGIQVIIEDYVHCPCVKIASLLANALIMYSFTVISVVAVLKIHLIS